MKYLNPDHNQFSLSRRLTYHGEIGRQRLPKKRYEYDGVDEVFSTLRQEDLRFN